MALKICDLTQHWSPLSGGVKRYLEGKMRYLENAAGYEHLLIVPAAADRLSVRGRTRVYEVRSPALPGSASYRALLDRRRILEILDAERPDVIEAGDPYRGAWIALEAGRRLSIPVVGYYHSDLPRRLGLAGPGPLPPLHALGRLALERYLLKLYGRMTATVAASQLTAARLGAMGLERVVRVPLGVDLEAFAPSPRSDEVRQRLGLDAGDRLLLFIGRLAPEKNVPALFGMMERLARERRGRRLTLLVVGDGELGSAVKRAVARRDDCVWLPYCDDPAELSACYGAADLFVHPGTAETFGLTVLEAQACGTPVLTVRGGGMEETVVAPHGFAAAASAAPQDLAAAATAALRAEAGGDAAERRAERRRQVAARFSARTTYASLVALYGRLSTFGWVARSSRAASAAAGSVGA